MIQCHVNLVNSWLAHIGETGGGSEAFAVAMAQRSLTLGQEQIAAVLSNVWLSLASCVRQWFGALSLRALVLCKRGHCVVPECIVRVLRRCHREVRFLHQPAVCVVLRLEFHPTLCRIAEFLTLDTTAQPVAISLCIRRKWCMRMTCHKLRMGALHVHCRWTSVTKHVLALNPELWRRRQCKPSGIPKCAVCALGPHVLNPLCGPQDAPKCSGSNHFQREGRQRLRDVECCKRSRVRVGRRALGLRLTARREHFKQNNCALGSQAAFQCLQSLHCRKTGIGLKVTPAVVIPRAGGAPVVLESAPGLAASAAGPAGAAPPSPSSSSEAGAIRQRSVSFWAAWFMSGAKPLRLLLWNIGSHAERSPVQYFPLQGPGRASALPLTIVRTCSKLRTCLYDPN